MPRPAARPAPLARAALAIAAPLLAALASPAPAQAQTQAQALANREDSSRLAVAVLGRVCLLGMGDPGATAAIAQPGNEFGFTEVPPEVAQSFLAGRRGVVRVLRRPYAGTIVLVVGEDGICSVWAQWADGDALRRYLAAMVEAGGMKGGGKLVPLGFHDRDGDRVWNWYLLPEDWYAHQLARRFADDGSRPVLVTLTMSPQGNRPMEAVLSAGRGR